MEGGYYALGDNTRNTCMRVEWLCGPTLRSGRVLQPALIIGPIKIKGEKNIACSPLVLLGRRISDSLPTETTCQPITTAMITLLTGSPGGAQTDVT